MMKATAATLLLTSAILGSACTAKEPPDSRGDRAKRPLDLSAPLGSMRNPVRAAMPLGQRDYLMRLRCPAGDAPMFERRGSMGAGPYGNVVDSYRVICRSGEKHEVILDMYHRHRETAAVPGFTALPEHPARLAVGCPPRVQGFEPGSYVFHMLEVERPARAANLVTELRGKDVDGNAFVRFVIGPDGRVNADSVEFPSPPIPYRLGPLVAEYLASVQFEPALHSAGCPVPQRAEMRFTSKSP